MRKTYERKYGTELNKGITLIALIVTIVTMLILAGVSLSIMLGNNGILNKATQAKKLYDVSAIKEALEMEKSEIAINQNRVDLDSYLEQITSGEKAYNLNSTDKIDDRNAEIIVNGEHKFLIKDKENGDVEIIYQGIAKIGDLALSSSSGTYTYPTSGTFSVISNSTGGALSVTSESPDVATVSLDGNTITVYPGTKAGKARIIVKSAAVGEYAENRAVYIATVENGTISISATPYDGTYDGAEHDALTNVTTTPTGTTITYSTDGVNYSSTMPTIKDTSSFTVSVSASKAGYKTQVETYTVTVNKADGDLTLSATSGTYTIGTAGSFTVSGNTGTISATLDNTSVADVSVSGNTITVTPKAAGTATITVTSAATSNYNEKSATYALTVKQKTYSVGTSVPLGGYNFYVIGDSGDNVTLLCKTTIGTANWDNAKTQASTFGNELGGSGRLMTKAEAQALSSSIRNIGTQYWLADGYSSGDAWYVSGDGDFVYYNSSSNYGKSKWVRPVVVISKSKL